MDLIVRISGLGGQGALRVAMAALSSLLVALRLPIVRWRVVMGRPVVVWGVILGPLVFRVMMALLTPFVLGTTAAADECQGGGAQKPGQQKDQTNQEQ